MRYSRVERWLAAGSDVKRNDHGAGVVVPLAVVARCMTKVSVLGAVGAALVSCDQVGSHVEVRELPRRIEVQVGPLERAVRMRGAVVVLHRVRVRLW